MMFMPDKVAALRETRRTLADGGTIHFTVWGSLEDNPHSAAAAEVIEGLVPGDTELRFRIPWELHDPALLQSLVSQAGYVHTRIDCTRLPVECESARTLAIGIIRGTPRSLLLEQRGFPLESVIAKVADRLTQIGGAAPYRGYAQALIVQAHKDA
jgi:hypothetical protein